MAVCPNGHDSASDDFCDICGMRMAAGAPAGQPGHRAVARRRPVVALARCGPFLPGLRR